VMSHFRIVVSLTRCGIQDDYFSPSQAFKMARHILQQLTTSSAGWAGQWKEDRMQVGTLRMIHVD
jgi:hypothetical protein